VEMKRAVFLRLLPGLLAWLTVASSASAHRLDEYLQATLVDISPGEIRLRLNLTPGVEVVDQVLDSIDRDGNEAISEDEAAAYCELLKRDLTLRIDQRDATLKVSASRFPESSELREGFGIIQIEFTATPGSLKPGDHHLALENRHLPKLSVYLFNAAKPVDHEVQIVRQTRNPDQSLGGIEFTYQGKPEAVSPAVLIAGFMVSGVTVITLLWRENRRRSRLTRPGDG
jgi:hypothetical protein